MRNHITPSAAALVVSTALGLAFAPLGLAGQGGSDTYTSALLPARSEAQHVTFPSRDGTMLQGDLLLPEGGCPDEGCTPIVSIGPYFGTSSQGLPVINPVAGVGPSDRFDDFIAYEFNLDGDPSTPGQNIFDMGYAFLMVDSRGFGESGGCNDYGGPGEQMDAYAAVEWAGTQAWSDGNVGMWGKSYDGWTQVMALAENPPHLGAVVVQSPIIDGFGIAFDGGVHHDTGWYATTHLYQLYDQAPPTAQYAAAQPEQFLIAEAGTADTCWVEQAPVPVAGVDHDLEYWRQRDLRPSASRNDDVAVLWSHGWNDVNTKSDQIFGAYTLADTADAERANRRAWFGHWDHVRGNEVDVIGRGGFLEEALDWFEGHLRGKAFRYEVNERNIVEVHDQRGQWRTETAYPPVDVQMTTLTLDTGSYDDDMGSGAAHGYWTISEPLEGELHVAGETTMRITADFTVPGAQFVGVLYDIDPEAGTATEISRQPARLAASGTEYTFQGTPSDYVLAAGHQLGFHVTANHGESQPYPTVQTVTVTSLELDVPFLTWTRESNLPGRRSAAGPFVINLGSLDLTATSPLTLPYTMPFPDDETRQAVSPDVTTGDIDAPVIVP